MNKFLYSLLLFISFSGLAQTPIDTVDTEKGKMVIFTNRTWKFLLDEEFDGIMNEALFNQIQADTNLNLVQTWDNDLCFTSERSNDLSRMNDTIWLAIALMLVFEGMLPFISPRLWRETFERMIQLRDGQIRFLGLTAMLAGVLILTVLRQTS